MEDMQLPPELERLERFLVSGPRSAPSAALRGRVLEGIRSELHREHTWSKWRFAAALAAALLVDLCLSLAVVQATCFALQQRESHPSVHEVARRIQQLSPDLSPEESLRRAVLVRIGAEMGSRTNLDDVLCQRETP